MLVAPMFVAPMFGNDEAARPVHKFIIWSRQDKQNCSFGVLGSTDAYDHHDGHHGHGLHSPPA